MKGKGMKSHVNLDRRRPRLRSVVVSPKSCPESPSERSRGRLRSLVFQELAGPSIFCCFAVWFLFATPCPEACHAHLRFQQRCPIANRNSEIRSGEFTHHGKVDSNHFAFVIE